MHKGKEYLEELLDEVDSDKASSIRDYVFELEKASLTDPLTGLWNRNYLEKELSKYKEQYNRNGTPFAYCLLDIKDFFVYNDKYGMEKGDEVLKTLGKTIKDNIRANDTAARIGGDEFVILLTNARDTEGINTIERIKEEMRSHDVYLHAGIADYHTLVKKNLQ
ncbi:MAG: GGDEF domain-containing protein [Candidatus Woesearchaeota archaeon]